MIFIQSTNNTELREKNGLKGDKKNKLATRTNSIKIDKNYSQMSFRNAKYQDMHLNFSEVPPPHLSAILLLVQTRPKPLRWLNKNMG